MSLPDSLGWRGPRQGNGQGSLDPGRGRQGGGGGEGAGAGAVPQPEPEPEPEATGAEPSWSLRGRHRVLSDAAASAPPPRPCPPCDGRERRGQPLAGRWAAGAMAAPEPLRPRLCRLVRGEHGYGFHLHGEKGRRGQFIRRVEPGSPAEAAALRAGDRLVEVNGVNVEGETHHQVGVCAPPPARRPADPPRAPNPAAPARVPAPRAVDHPARHCLRPGLRPFFEAGGDHTRASVGSRGEVGDMAPEAAAAGLLPRLLHPGRSCTEGGGSWQGRGPHCGSSGSQPSLFALGLVPAQGSVWRSWHLGGLREPGDPGAFLPACIYVRV